MKLSEIKAIKELTGCDVRELIEADEDDFTVNDWRIISAEIIDETLVDELESNSYILGCFSAWAIARATGWPMALIEAAQAGERYDDIGHAMTDAHVQALAGILVQLDGYGHHFASYDGETHEVTIDGKQYYAFKN